MSAIRWIILITLLFAMTSVVGCQRMYYGTMEKLGFQKREILVDRVEEARDAQEEAGEQFRSALERFRSVVNVEGGDLEEKYETLRAEFERSEKKAQAVTDRIDAVEDVAQALFAEWEEELERYSNDRLRQSSRQKLAQTRQQYRQLIQAMRQAEKKIDPVLDAFRDQVLYLKHNLNARAVASLKTELRSIETDVEQLLREMQASIDEANQFVRNLEAQRQDG